MSMAEFNTIEDVEGVLTSGQKAFDLMTGLSYLDTDNLVQRTIDNLEEKIRELKQTEEDFKNTFGLSSLNEFAARVNKYYIQNNLINFSGSRLQAIVDDFKMQLDQNDAEFEQHIRELFFAYLQNYTDKGVQDILSGRPVQNAFMNQVINEFRIALGRIHGGSGHLFKAATGRVLSQNENGAFQLIASQATDGFKEYVNKAYQEASKKGGVSFNGFEKDKKYNVSITQKTQIGARQLQMSFGVRFANIIRNSGVDMLNGTKIKKMIDSGQLKPRDISDKNRQIIRLFCEELGVSGAYQTFVQRRCQTMLSQDPYMFFVGNSFTGLEGILGELNAVIAITDLLGEKYVGKAIDWIGSKPGVYSKKQPSIDIVINEIVDGSVKAQFGLQVKNTVEDLGIDIAHYINFADTDVSRILTNAGIDSEDIQNVLISDTYNVPFKRIGNTYKQVGYNTTFNNQDPSRFNRYVDLDKQIDELVNSINIYLAQYASDFIYMQNPDFPDALATLDNQVINLNTTGNFCYIVGPKVYFANRMLQQLEKQLTELQGLSKKEQQASLQFETYFKEEGKSKSGNYNIISYLNSNHKNTLSKYTLKMRSSWGFK